MLNQRTCLYLEKDRGIPCATFCGRYNYNHAHAALDPHAHQRSIEICYLFKGRQQYKVNDKVYCLKGGDVFITFPDEQHSTGCAPEEKGTLYWIILRLPQPNETFLGLSSIHSDSIIDALLSVKARHFQGTPKLHEFFEHIFELYNQEESRLQIAQIANSIYSLLFEIIECSQWKKKRAKGASVQSTLAYIASHKKNNLRVADLADRMGLSTAHFSTLFKEQIGLSPADYILREKISEAHRILKFSTKSVTEVAHELGFSSSQYFATVFKRLEGICPRQSRHEIDATTPRRRRADRAV